jgi:hypothetical protein
MLTVVALFMNTANICILLDDGLSGPKHAVSGIIKLFACARVTPQFFFYAPQTGSNSRSQWARGLRHELSSAARTLGSWVRIPLKA